MDTLVIGAGPIGLGIAWRAAQRGRDVVVLDRGEPGGGASFHAAGMLAPITEATYGEEALLALTLESARRYPGFRRELAAASGHDLASAAPGTLFVALDRDQLEALRHLHAFQAASGLDARWLDAAACREHEPGLHPRVRAGILTAEQEVDPRRLTAALGAALAAAGGTIRTGAGVRRVLVDSGVCTGAELDGGEQVTFDQVSLDPKGGRVVLAAGCWSGGIGGVPAAVREAVRPVKGQILRLRPRPGDGLPIRHIVRTEEVYLVPRALPGAGPGDPARGEVVVGATVEERGFDQSLTGGGMFELLRAAIEAVPAVRELELVEASAGLRPGSRDNAPLLGPVGTGPAGLLIATGHYRNGILLTPVTADALGDVLAGAPVPDLVRPFLPDRFRRANPAPARAS
ncbi:MAG TPA: glycine oxidase ThiO [Actinomycetota bacterium]|nr:glycine oxidase ThiO [Actinomycetota bacterium]